MKDRLDDNWYQEFAKEKDPFENALERAVAVQTPRRPLPRPKPAPKRAQDVEQLLRITQVAELLGVDLSYVYKLIRNGHLRHQPIGERGKRVPVSAIEEYKLKELQRHGKRAG